MAMRVIIRPIDMGADDEFKFVVKITVWTLEYTVRCGRIGWLRRGLRRHTYPSITLGLGPGKISFLWVQPFSYALSTRQ